MNDSTPFELRRVVIREELFALTGNALSARILDQLLYWSKRVKDYDQFLAEEKARATRSKAPLDAPLSFGWIYKKTTELADEIMADEGKTTIRRRLQEMIDIGWISQRTNPQHTWDKTLQYRVNVLAVIEDLAYIGFHLTGYVLQGESSKVQNELSKVQFEPSEMQGELSKVHGEPAIPEITTKLTTDTANGGRTENAAAADPLTISALEAALKRINRGLTSPFTGVKTLAAKLHQRGEAARTVNEAWAACQVADNPAGAFMLWMKDGYIPAAPVAARRTKRGATDTTLRPATHQPTEEEVAAYIASTTPLPEWKYE